ncbi:CD109 antigen-like isoform X1 [Anopheles albimanus]|uniref:CD109 antigen-like isoform X1 n=1 Tax=Anopheles albimanus TaxID=7167 RepID=UPI00163EE906|nr:CD109 antigen-like isoform X1 [Anopheles albimanus]
MWLLRGISFFAALALISFTQALLIVGPKSLRANRDYTVVLSNFFGKLNKAELFLRLEGHDDDGQTLLDLNRTIDVRQNTNKITSFKIPPIKSNGNFKITIEGVRGFVYTEVVELEYIPKSISGLIQLSKPVYKPGDSVQFRVIVLDPDLKPPAGLKKVTVTVQDSNTNNIRKWSDAPLYNGVFEGQLDIAPSPLLGPYNIIVEANDEKLVSKSFVVKEYVLSTFEVDVFPTVIPLEVHQALNLAIVANYYFGKPVIGRVKFQLYDEDDNLELSKEFDVNGMLQVHLPFTNDLIIYEEQKDYKLNVTFTEQYTNRTVVKERTIPVYKYQYQVTLDKESPAFRPGSQFKCFLKVENRDGTPAKGVTVLVQIYGLGLSNPEQSYTTDDTGAIKLQLYPSVSAEAIQITASIDDRELLEETIIKMERNVEKFIAIELKDRYVGLNYDMSFKITCSDQLKFLVYYIVSKGNIVDSGFARPTKVFRYTLTLKATEKMMPRSKVVVATLTSNNIVVFDYVDIEFHEFQNKIDIRIDEPQLSPGGQIEIKLNGHPKTYVALASYDESLHQHGNDHDVIREHLWKVFDEFHAVQPNEHDKIHSMGLFAKTLDEVTIDTANDKSARTGGAGGGGARKSTIDLVQKLIRYRTDFRESWLWKNITLPRSGRSTMIEQVPDTITSWYLTGFSIDPVHGIGIIKKPIRYNTVKQFYIVDNLPYSIKRGEVIALQFTLFNTLGAEYIADVTMFNVKDEIEFIGQPADAKNYTKSVSVPPNVGFSIPFLVKAKKLGEMTVRVKASIMLGQENDAIEKVIRVTPESLVIAAVKSQFFSFNEQNSQTFEMVLDINRKLDFNSVKIDFSLTPNLLTDVISNLDNLLAVPTGCGEQNMVKFVPNVVVLDYLTAIGSKDTTAINKAKSYLQTGYQNQMNYRQTDGSYGVWQTSGGSVFLTAFVAKSLQTAAKYIYVDEHQVSRAYDWLSSKQQLSGQYAEVGSIIHRDMQGGIRQGLALTSYVMIAFLENPQQATRHRTVVESGMRYIANNVETATDPYDLAIATYALWLNKHAKKSRILDKLIGLSTTVQNGTQRYWPRSAHEIETTAYALLSFVEAGKNIDGIAVLRWLVNQRYTTGAFPRTQDTFVGLKALTKLSQKINPSKNEYDMQLTHDNLKREYRVDSNNFGKFVLDDLPQTTRKISVNIAGQGSGFIQLAYSYLLNLVNFEKSFKLAVKKLDTGSGAVLKLDICASFIPKLTDERSDMALVEVNLPSGYVTRTDFIEQKSTINPIKKREILHGATTAVLYYDNMGTEINCFTITAHRLFKVALNRPAYVKVHDYYHPDFNAVTIYETVKQEVCDVCDPGDCPQSCLNV